MFNLVLVCSEFFKIWIYFVISSSFASGHSFFQEKYSWCHVSYVIIFGLASFVQDFVGFIHVNKCSCHLFIFIVLEQELANIFCKEKIFKNFGSADQMVFTATAQLCHSMKGAIANIEQNEYGCVPRKSIFKIWWWARFVPWAEIGWPLIYTVLLSDYTIICLSILLVMDIWTVSTWSYYK